MFEDSQLNDSRLISADNFEIFRVRIGLLNFIGDLIGFPDAVRLMRKPLQNNALRKGDREHNQEQPHAILLCPYISQKFYSHQDLTSRIEE